MKIAGINKNSFVDMKGMIAYVVFTPGCNFDCWYCHNRHILGGDLKLLSEEEVLQDLSSRKKFVDIVVITGGEPTLQIDLEEFIFSVKSLDFS
jgi:pyruvate formate lyase activating enzyme